MASPGTNWLIGLLAGTLTTISFVPQVLKSWRTRSVNDLSVGMLVAFSIGVFLWIVYGLNTAAAPVVISNVVTFVLALALLAMKIRFR